MRFWTEDEDRVIRWAARRCIPRKVIGRHIDRTAKAIQSREFRLGIVKPVALAGGFNRRPKRTAAIWNAGIESIEDCPPLPAKRTEPVLEVRSLYKGVVPRQPSLRELLEETAADYDLEAQDLLKVDRRPEISRPRQDFMWRARRVKWASGKHRYSLPQIGHFLGGMDHTTVLHGVRAHAHRISADDRNCRSAPTSARAVNF